MYRFIGRSCALAMWAAFVWPPGSVLLSDCCVQLLDGRVDS